MIPTVGSSGPAAATDLLGSVGSADATLERGVLERKAAWRARISAMTRGAVQVLDLGSLLAYDEMATSLSFQLRTLTIVLKTGRLEYMLAPFTARSLYHLATSDDPGLPCPPPLNLFNRNDHAIIGDSVKGAKPTDKGWNSLAGPLGAAGWADLWDGIVGGAKLSGLAAKLDAYVAEYAFGPRRDGTVVLGSSHHVINFAWTMSDCYDAQGMPRCAIFPDQELLLEKVFQHAAYLPGFFLELGGSAKAWYTTPKH